MPLKWKLWTIIEDYENAQAASDSSWGNSPGGVHEAAWTVPKCPGPRVECPAAPHQRDRPRKTRHYGRHGLAVGPLLRHHGGNVDGVAVGLRFASRTVRTRTEN